ncbi:hypothetical protein [Priestia megaterium]|uniref:hypothetical protein n=1 Tax=Priestia megaterium TaxID=1404 RepID=UPI0023DC6C08|nr:hypothetical protein [Priestia megaterium]MDF2010216.1 hypothetical protein [Priestia megaterium]
MDENKIIEMLAKMNDRNEERHKEVMQGIQETRQAITETNERMDEGFKEVTERFDKLELLSNDDVVAILKRLEKNTSNLSQDIETLSGLYGKHEVVINRIKNN